MPQLMTEMVGEICTIADSSPGPATPPAVGGSVLRISPALAVTTVPGSGVAGGATALVTAATAAGSAEIGGVVGVGDGAGAGVGPGVGVGAGVGVGVGVGDGVGVGVPPAVTVRMPSTKLIV